MNQENEIEMGKYIKYNYEGKTLYIYRKSNKPDVDYIIASFNSDGTKKFPIKKSEVFKEKENV